MSGFRDILLTVMAGRQREADRELDAKRLALAEQELASQSEYRGLLSQNLRRQLQSQTDEEEALKAAAQSAGEVTGYDLMGPPTPAGDYGLTPRRSPARFDPVKAQLEYFAKNGKADDFMKLAGQIQQQAVHMATNLGDPQGAADYYNEYIGAVTGKTITYKGKKGDFNFYDMGEGRGVKMDKEGNLEPVDWYAETGMERPAAKTNYKDRELPLKGGLIQKQESLDGGTTWKNIGDPYPRHKPGSDGGGEKALDGRYKSWETVINQRLTQAARKYKLTDSDVMALGSGDPNAVNMLIATLGRRGLGPDAVKGYAREVAALENLRTRGYQEIEAGRSPLRLLGKMTAPAAEGKESSGSSYIKKVLGDKKKK